MGDFDTYQRRRSSWWFLLPIFLSLLGGIISYFVLRADDPSKAKNCMYLGIVVAALQVGINIVLIGEVALIADMFNAETEPLQ